MTRTSICIPPVVTGTALKDYFFQHVAVVPEQPHLYVVVSPLHVFKKACSRGGFLNNRIVNLIIPVGAHIYAGDLAFIDSSDRGNRKMRASVANVHSIAYYHSRGRAWNHLASFDWRTPSSMRAPVTCDSVDPNFDPTLVKPTTEAFSDYKVSFRYAVGETVHPHNGFSTEDDACAGGIHFFLNLRDALAY